MRVHFYATLRQIVGQKTVDIDVPAGATVQQIVEAVVRRYPALRRELLDEQGRLHGHIHVFINGRDAHYLDQAAETPVQAEDRVDIFPAVGGGSEEPADHAYRREVHGVPAWLLRDYLVELGGEAQQEGVICGPNWEARYHRIEDFRLGSLRIGRLALEIQGSPQALAQLIPALEMKLMRGGG